MQKSLGWKKVGVLRVLCTTHDRGDSSFLAISIGCGSFTATPQTLVFQSPIVPCLVISLFLQKAVAMVVEPWASLRIWPGDCVDTPVVRGSPSTRRNHH